MQTANEEQNTWKAPVVCVIVALITRTLYLLAAGKEPTFLSPGMDAEIYRNWADALIGGTQVYGPYFRAPLYPWLISALGNLFGNTFWPIRILQVLISSLMAGGLAILARRWMGNRAGWIAGLTWALYGASIYFDGEGLIASLFTSGMIGLLLLLDGSARKHWTLHVVLLAVLFALQIALRANALAFAPVLALAVWWTGKEQRVPLSRRSVTIISAAALSFLLILPIVLHNHTTGAGWTISSQGGINLFLGNHETASGAYAVDPDFGADWTQKQVENRAEMTEERSLSEAEISRHYTQRALKFWIDHPVDAIGLTFRKFLATLNWRELGNNRPLNPYLWNVQPIFAMLLTVGFPLIMIVALAFMIPAWKTMVYIRPAILLALIHALVMIAFFVNARYRFPMTPMLVLLFAYGIDQLLPDRRRAKAGRGWWIRTTATILASAIIVLIPRPVPSIDEDQAWLLHHANALLRLERYDEAREAFQQLLESHPNVLNGHLNLGVIELREDNLNEARGQFAAELDLRPDNELAWNNLGVTYELLNDTESAIESYRQAFNLDPTNDDARLNLVRLLTKRMQDAADVSQWERVFIDSRELIALSPDSPVPLYNHAVFLAGSGQISEAYDLLQTITQQFPDFDPARIAFQQLQLELSTE
ncbi:MAG TPA: tetratricopeptide repeat protein [Bacteroidetes bacterium]|nr:lipoprotein NlpI [bacterium BMS3Bbin04]HDO66228.1 tetratricopeptide repeat protein [Bacteroidota bacterium]HEX05353.1 tetratricopeptide repeat protein [Bacteroidota bacterium]